MNSDCAHLVTETRPARRRRSESRLTLAAFLIYCGAGLALLSIVAAAVWYISVAAHS